MKNSQIPRLGIGVGLRSSFYSTIFATSPPIEWFEIISENFMNGGKPLKQLEKVLEKYKVVMHGVSLNIGSSDPLNWQYLRKVKNLCKKTQSPWISDHLSWGQVAGSHFHDLLPVPFTKEMLRHIVQRARIVQDFLEVPFALENISSYITYSADEMEEWEFYRAVVEEADIYMMLDINNVYVSSRNHGYDPQEFLNFLPMDRVLQIHISGHDDRGSHCLDTHDQAVSDAVWKLYEQVWPQTGGVSTLLEWDEKQPSLDEIWKEAKKAKEFQCTPIPR